MNIVILGDFKFPFGSAAASRIRNISEELILNGCNVHLLSNTLTWDADNPWKIYNGIRYKFFKPNFFNKLFKKIPSNLLHYILSIFSFGCSHIKELDGLDNIDVILIYDYSFLKVLPYHFYCKKRGVKYLRDMVECYTRDGFTGGVFNPLYYDFLLDYYFLAKRSDGIIAISNYIKNSFYKRLPVIIIPAVINVNESVDYDEPSIPQKPLTFTFISSFNRRELPELILDSIKLLANTSLRINMIGNNGIAGYPNKIKKRIANDTQLNEIVHFWGRISDQQMKELKQKTDFFIYLKKKDRAGLAAFPTRLPEYLITGRPVIASNVGDLNLYLTDNVDVLFIENTIASLNNMFLKINACPDGFKRIGKSGLHACKDKFSRSAHVSALIKFLKSFDGTGNYLP